MDLVLWVIQAFLALAFLISGVVNISVTLGAREKTTAWYHTVPKALVRTIAGCEITGAIGLIMPGVTHILPWLTVAAALGLALIMLFATLFHLSRREYHHVSFPLVLLILSIIVLYGRLIHVPLT